MAVTTEATIFELLMAQAQVAANVVGLQVAWPNKSFTPPADQKFLRVVFVPNTTDRVFIDSDGPHQRMGLLQISVQWPKNLGESAAREVAGQVAATFPTDLWLGSGAVRVRIRSRPHVADLLVEDARIQIPVMIEWECWA